MGGWGKELELWIDSGDIEEIKKAVELGAITGVTTNPTLIAKVGYTKDFREVVREICRIVDGPVSVEAVSLHADGIVEEARELVKLGDNVVIKIPVIPEGLKAMKRLSQEGIRVNATLVFSTNQALLAARAGAAYVSPFIGRLDDIGHNGMQVVRDAAQIFRSYNMPTRVIAASIRHPLHVIEAAKAGAHVATIPYRVIEQMVKHPLTDIGLERFLADWQKVVKQEAVKCP